MPREVVVAPCSPFIVSPDGEVAEIVLRVFADGTVALRSTHGGHFSASGARTSQARLLAEVLPHELAEALGDYQAAQSFDMVTR